MFHLLQSSHRRLSCYLSNFLFKNFLSPLPTSTLYSWESTCRPKYIENLKTLFISFCESDAVQFLLVLIREPPGKCYKIETIKPLYIYIFRLIRPSSGVTWNCTCDTYLEVPRISMNMYHLELTPESYNLIVNANFR